MVVVSGALVKLGRFLPHGRTSLGHSHFWTIGLGAPRPDRPRTRAKGVAQELRKGAWLSGVPRKALCILHQLASSTSCPASPCLLPLASLPMRGGTRDQGPTGSPAQRPTDTRPGGSPSTQTKNQKWILTSNKCPLSGIFVENDYVSMYTTRYACTCP